MKDAIAKPNRRRSPADCLRTRYLSAPCTECGKRPTIVHIPKGRRGFFCTDHCPLCRPAEEVEK